MIIGFAGVKRSGKDTCANVLVKKFGFRKVSLADELKTIASKVFNINLNVFYDDNTKDRQFETSFKVTSSQVHSFIVELNERKIDINAGQELELFENMVGTEISSPRQLLQWLGTDIARKYVSEDIWLKLFFNYCNSVDGNIVCADARFPNEREAIKKHGGINVLVMRPELELKDGHISENLVGSPDEYDVFIVNDRSKELMESDVESWWFTRSNRNAKYV